MPFAQYAASAYRRVSVVLVALVRSDTPIRPPLGADRSRVSIRTTRLDVRIGQRRDDSRLPAPCPTTRKEIMEITKQVLEPKEIKRIKEQLGRDGDEVTDIDMLRAAGKAEDWKTGYSAW